MTNGYKLEETMNCYRLPVIAIYAINLSGRYSIQLTESVTEKASRGEGIYPQWKTNLNGVKNNTYKYRLHSRLVNAIINRVNEIEDLSASNIVYSGRLHTINHTITRWQSSSIPCQSSSPRKNVV